MRNLAGAYGTLKKFDQAVPLYEETLKIQKAKLGPGRPDTLGTMKKLAWTYYQKKQLDRSIPLYEEILKHEQVKPGRDHPQTRLTVQNLGINYLAARRVEKALPLLEEAYRGAKEQAPPDLLLALLDAYGASGDKVKYANLLRGQLPRVLKMFPRDSPRLEFLIGEGAITLHLQKKWTEAEPLLREWLAIREKQQPDAWNTFNTKSMLGGALLGQKKYAAAEPLLLAGYEA